MTKIGFHINSDVGITSPWLAKFPSKVHLILALSVGGNIPQLINLCKVYPNTRFIYRAWSYGELGNSDHFEDYYKKYGDDPEPLIKAHESVFNATSEYNNRISYQLWNECGHDREIWPHFIAFNTHFVKAMDARGLSASVLGLAPGHPAWEGSGDARSRIKEAWVQARPLFEAIIESNQTHLINLHEYHAYPHTRFVPWVIGRYRWLLDDAISMGLPTDKLKIVIGESGFTDPNALNFPSLSGPNGFQWSLAQGYTPEQLADDYADMVHAVYDPSPNLLGLCYFSLGGGEIDFWKEFDLLQEPKILQRLYELERENGVYDLYEVIASTLNVRQEPTTTSVIVRQLKVGDKVEVSVDWVEANGYRWRKLRDGFYVAEMNVTTGEKFLEKYAGYIELTTLLDEIEVRLDKIRSLVKG